MTGLRAARLASLVLTGLAVAGFACTTPASAQIMLYENRLPDGFAYVRFVNTTADALDLAPSFTDPVKLGNETGNRISPYRVVENVTGKTFKFDVGGGSVSFQMTPGKFHTLLLSGTAQKTSGAVLIDATDYNQLKVKLGFYNATADCAPASLVLEPSGQSVFAGIAPGATRIRSTNPTESAIVHAMCGAKKVPTLDLGELSAGGLYSVWLMAPNGTPVTFLSQDLIAPYQK